MANRPDTGSGSNIKRDTVIATLTAVADKLDNWAETAELMGDDHNAANLRERARTSRLRAMELLDERSPTDHGRGDHR